MVDLTGPIEQLCYLVADVEAAARCWAELMRAGPFFLEHSVVPGYAYRGQEVTVDVTTAIGFCGPLQIELMRLNGDAPSVFREGWERSGEGLNHVMIRSTDFGADVARYAAAGCPLVQFKDFGHLGKNGFIDTLGALGFYIQLLEAGPGSDDIVAYQKEAHRTFDGRDPLRVPPRPAV